MHDLMTIRMMNASDKAHAIAWLAVLQWLQGYNWSK